MNRKEFTSTLVIFLVSFFRNGVCTTCPACDIGKYRSVACSGGTCEPCTTILNGVFIGNGTSSTNCPFSCNAGYVKYYSACLINGPYGNNGQMQIPDVGWYCSSYFSYRQEEFYYREFGCNYCRSQNCPWSCGTNCVMDLLSQDWNLGNRYRLTCLAGCVEVKPCTAVTDGFFIGSGTSSTNCPFACNAGFVKSGFLCVECSFGFYELNGVCTKCPVCVNGQWRSASCTSSDPGSCQPCTAVANAYFTGAGTGRTNCPFECNMGYAKFGSGCVINVSCQVGFYGLDGVCTKCPACDIGKYQGVACSGYNVGACEPCTAVSNGVFTGNGTTSTNCPFACNAGYVKYYSACLINGPYGNNGQMQIPDVGWYCSSYFSYRQEEFYYREFGCNYCRSQNCPWSCGTNCVMDLLSQDWNLGNRYRLTCLAGCVEVKPCTAVTDGFFIGSGTSSTNCPFACNAGFVKSGFLCVECSFGFYELNGVCTKCPVCVNGQWRSASCTSSDPGSCQPCTAVANAYFTGAGTGRTNCPFECNMGYAKFGSGCVINVSCQAGFYGLDGVCTRCPACDIGKYQSVACSGYNVGACEPCTAVSNGVFIGNGTSSTNCPFACNVGYLKYYSLCETGTYGNNGQMQIPDAGWYCSSYFSYRQEEFYYREHGCNYCRSQNCPWSCGTNCVMDLLSQDWNLGSRYRLTCLAGCVTVNPCTAIANARFIGSGTSSSSCPWECNAGYEKTGSSCFQCAIGKYGVKGVCMPCQDIQNATFTGSGTSSTDCQWECNAGYFKYYSSCILCPLGQYLSNKTCISCRVCEPGYWLDGCLGSNPGVCMPCLAKENSRFIGSGTDRYTCPYTCNAGYDQYKSSCVKNVSCQPGFYGQNGTCVMCPACDIGKYRNIPCTGYDVGTCAPCNAVENAEFIGPGDNSSSCPSECNAGYLKYLSSCVVSGLRGDNGLIQVLDVGWYCVQQFSGVHEQIFTGNLLPDCHNCFVGTTSSPCPWSCGSECKTKSLSWSLQGVWHDYYCSEGCQRILPCTAIANGFFIGSGTTRLNCPFECNAGYSKFSRSCQIPVSCSYGFYALDNICTECRTCQSGHWLDGCEGINPGKCVACYN